MHDLVHLFNVKRIGVILVRKTCKLVANSQSKSWVVAIAGRNQLVHES